MPSATPLGLWQPVGSLQKTPVSATTIVSILTWSSVVLCSLPVPISRSTTAPLRGDVKSYFRDTEFKFYCLVIAVSITLISWNTIRFQVDGQVPYDSMWTSLRYATFQVMSIITTTGYGTADFEEWPAAFPIYLGDTYVLRWLCRFHRRWHETGAIPAPY